MAKKKKKKKKNPTKKQNPNLQQTDCRLSGTNPIQNKLKEIQTEHIIGKLLSWKPKTMK